MFPTNRLSIPETIPRMYISGIHGIQINWGEELPYRQSLGAKKLHTPHQGMVVQDDESFRWGSFAHNEAGDRSRVRGNLGKSLGAIRLRLFGPGIIRGLA